LNRSQLTWEEAKRPRNLSEIEKIQISIDALENKFIMIDWGDEDEDWKSKKTAAAVRILGKLNISL
jgi:hypothetical protein